jgi:enoyl-CoA hydratase
MDYQAIEVLDERPLSVLRLNRPDARNALNGSMAAEIVAALSSLEADDAVRCVIITGGESTFCAGADIREMAGKSSVDMLKNDHLSALWSKVGSFQKPVIAAISGYALGGGLELAMCCDMIVASEGSKFGQPEINIGLIPGGGGTQRLLRAVGKYKAMEMILTGSAISVEEAHSSGLVNRVVKQGEALTEAKRLALEISAKSPLALRLAKRAVARAEEEGLAGGLEFERALFYLSFATKDREEGMKAFMEKRKPEFTGD